MPPARPRRIVLCLDGTWNSTYTQKLREDKTRVVKPSNVLKLCRAVLPRDPETEREQIVYYDTGVGSLAKYPGFSNHLLSLADKVLGGGWGAGFEANMEDALNFLALNYREGDEVFVFGFSRGAATARGVTRFLDWTDGRLPVKRDAFYLPELFRRFVLQKGEGSGTAVVAEIDRRRASESQARGQRPPAPLQLQPVRVELLGVWDTVMALGSRFRATEGTSTASRSFYLDRQPARTVRHARQALAIDEARFDFRPEIWDGHGPDQTLEQRWFVGVHSNVGGGYVQDGLANIPFHWILGEAKAAGLAIDSTFAGFYRPFAEDRLYRSESVLYRVLDRLRGRFGRGRRAIAQPAGANLSLDPSVFERMAADPKAHREDGSVESQLYRPPNVLSFLACLPDLEGYLREMEAKAQEEESKRLQGTGREPRPVNRALPQDARDEIARLRPSCTGTAQP